METEDTKESIEELSTIFSTANFPCEVENKDNQAVDEDEIDLNIGNHVAGIMIYCILYELSMRMVIDKLLHQLNQFSFTFWFPFFEDDINLDDPGKKPKEQNILATLNKHKLKFQAFTAGQCHFMFVNQQTPISVYSLDNKLFHIFQVS